MDREPPRVGYVLKRYPRFSETFIVTEILAHEAAGLELEIFSLYPPNDTHFQNAISQVRAPVTYLPGESLKSEELWAALQSAAAAFPGFYPSLEAARGEQVRELYQALHLALDVRARGITHLHAHFATSATAVARMAARFAGIEYTCTMHAKDLYHESVDPVDLRRKLRDAAAVVTVSDFNVAFLRDNYGKAADGVLRIYNGLSLDSFEYRASQHRPPGVVAVGRLIEKKGFADLIDACAIVARRRGGDFTCRITGSGPLEAELRERIDRQGLGGTVQLVGPRPQAVVASEVRDACVFAAPCVVGNDDNRDGLPTVLLEAMALGTPCVSTDVTGIPEIVRDGETGLLVPQHDPVTLAGAIERLLGDRALRVGLAARARRLIEADFDIRRNAAAIRAVFGSAANHANTAAA